jgi:copper chaperone CopZ
MEEIILELPAMYADHHVLTVRDTLTALDGLEEVYASSAWKQVMLSFDPAKITQSAIEEALANAGYPVGEGEPPILVEFDKIKRDPKWEELDIRVTETYEAEVQMSGEFRR